MWRIREFLVGAEALHKYDSLLDDLDHTIIPNLEAFPQIGKQYIGDVQHSTEALMTVARLPRNARTALRQYIHDEYTILYVLAPDMIHIVTVRHQHELSFTP
ncbi:MAG: type II toxin-antitoxin system RelE/ParE family toxin [Steroidobacteraceae bacterium]